jgi:hypothetical protein
LPEYEVLASMNRLDDFLLLVAATYAVIIGAMTIRIIVEIRGWQDEGDR